ncbi:MAG: dynamin family protein, partial [Cyanobacteria bacterium J06649_4]
MTTIDGTLTAWAQFTGKRRAVATQLNQLATRLRTAETIGAEESGQLGLSQTIREVEQTAEGLEKGVYRLMVMGDMKRGKSTLLNALIGETLLPSDVNPCTALLTTLRYGPEKRVILHYKNGRKDGREPEAVSLETFQQTYVISPTESKRLAEQEKEAFPDISHVVVEYPLPLLQQGIELIDTPGLNDTEARNEQVLDYLKDCQAVLFVLNATQPFTLDEQRYLNNYLKDAGLALFFIVNGWDRIRSGLLDPEDTAAVASAEANVRDVFSTNLKDYAPAGRPLRLFEISALQALRQRLADTSLSGSGLPKLLTDLDHFLAYERGPAELHRAQNVASRAYRSASTSIARRIPLLDETLETLEAKVASVQGDFSQLEGIRDRYRNVIHTSRDINIQTVSDSFKTYILNLEKTFEADFANSQPDLHFLDFLEADKRQEFYTAFKRAFERYLNDRLAVWEVEAKETIGKAIDELNASAAESQVAYAEIVQVIHDKGVGQREYGVGDRYDAEKNKSWA